MLIGVPKEIKDNEFRVGMTPAAVAELVHHGHQVIVETAAGLGSGSPDEEYVRAGAKLSLTGPEVFAQAEMIVKVEGAARGRAQAPETRADPVHLPASRARSRADARSHGVGRDLHRL